MTLIGVASSFVISVFVTRLFGPSGRGAYALALLWITTIGFVFNPGLYAAANYFMSSGALARGRVLAIVTTLSGGFGVVGAGVAFGIVRLTGADTFGSDLDAVAWTIAGGVLAFVISTTLNGVLFGLRYVRTTATITGGTTVVYLLLVVILWQQGESRLLWYIQAYVVVLMGEALARVGFTWHYLGREWTGVARTDIRAVLQYAFAVYGGRVLMLVVQKIDSYGVVWFLGSTALGYYSVATTFAEQLLLIPTAINLVIMNNIARESLEQASEMTHRLLQGVLLISVASGVALAVIGSGAIILIYGSAFVVAIAPFLLMIPGLICVSTYLVLEPFFQSRRHPLYATGSTAVGVAVTLIGTVVLTPRFGVTGAAVAYSLSYLAQAVTAYWLFIRLTQSPWQRVFQWSYGMALRKWYAALPIRPAQRG
jgi:O-antigen/teichoic acid export membrane protein